MMLPVSCNACTSSPRRGAANRRSAILQWVWNFGKNQTPKILDAISRHDAWGGTVVLKSDRKTEAYLAGFATAIA